MNFLAVGKSGDAQDRSAISLNFNENIFDRPDNPPGGSPEGFREASSGRRQTRQFPWQSLWQFWSIAPWVLERALALLVIFVNEAN